MPIIFDVAAVAWLLAADTKAPATVFCTKARRFIFALPGIEKEKSTWTCSLLPELANRCNRRREVSGTRQTPDPGPFPRRGGRPLRTVRHRIPIRLVRA